MSNDSLLMIEHYLKFRDFFSPFAWRNTKIPDFIYLIFKRAVTFADYWASVLTFFLEIHLAFFMYESCQSINLVFQDRVLRLMSHCFFPLKMYRFLLHTNRCQTFLMCTSCVSSSEHNYRSDFFKSVQSQFCWSPKKFIVVWTSSQCLVLVRQFAILCALNFFLQFITSNSRLIFLCW